MRAVARRHRSIISTIAVVTLSALALTACAGTSSESEAERERERYGSESPEQRAEEAANGEFDAKIAPPVPTQQFTGRTARATTATVDLRTVTNQAPAKMLRVEAMIPSMIPGGGPKADPLARNSLSAPAVTAVAQAPAPTVTGDGLDFTSFGTGWPPVVA